MGHAQRRRFESVYYHMRSICASNPIESARESLKVMLDENRKKYENAQRKYQEAASTTSNSGGSGDASAAVAAAGPLEGPLRREVWCHPEGGRRIYRTAPLSQPSTQLHDELCAMDQDEVSVLAENLY